ncbi:MAG TPA: DUF2948 family protein [Xanthobacteraceae bacterium]|nr:DUF2948 family protein [Xanthobacteraceae bacterium]
MEPLKLIALDRDDLEVVSAHLQDAAVKVSDIVWLPKERRLVLGLDRFDWLAANGANPEFRRCRTGLRFERVFSCKHRGIDLADKDAMQTLLAVNFHETDAPSGVVTLAFASGAALRLDVECLEAEIVDLGPTWDAAECPFHAETVASDSEASKTPPAPPRQG